MPTFWKPKIPKAMWKILKYSFKDVFRSKWLLIYFGFFFVVTWFLLYFTNDPSKGLVSLLNIILMLIPLMVVVFSTIYVYSTREFTELLLAQPVRRRTIFAGQYLGLSLSMAMSFLLGTGIPFLFFGIQHTHESGSLINMLLMGIMLSFVFSALAFAITIYNENRIKGFGLAILVWLVMAILYDGLLMILMVNFSDYPLEQPAIILSLLNPIDLARINILLELDISALMGYTGAVFGKFFGAGLGLAISILTLLLWILVPFGIYLRKAVRRDF